MKKVNDLRNIEAGYTWTTSTGWTITSDVSNLLSGVYKFSCAAPVLSNWLNFKFETSEDTEATTRIFGIFPSLNLSWSMGTYPIYSITTLKIYNWLFPAEG